MPSQLHFVKIGVALLAFSNLLIASNHGSCCQSHDLWIDKDEDENYIARHECSFVQAGNAFLMFGGRESSQRLDLYDFQKNKWSLGKEAPKEFNHFQATYYQGFVWVIGAFKDNNFPRETPEESVWLYDPSADEWIQGPEIPEHRRRGGAGLVVYNDKFYLIGGNTIGHDGGYVNWFDEYNPQTNEWTELPPASQARDHFHAAILNGVLYASGGRKSGGEGGFFSPLIDVVDTYNFATGKWSTLNENLPTPRAAPGIAVFKDQLFVMGGEGEERGPAYKIVEAYNPEKGVWSRMADMLYARHGTQAIVSGKGIYIAGGSPKRGGGRQLNMEVYSHDSPEPYLVTPSRLISAEEISVAVGTSIAISLEATVGNAGCFINKVDLKGNNAKNFSIQSDIDQTLILANSKRTLTIKNNGPANQKKAYLLITYNGTQELIINLASSLTTEKISS
ncbi:hypothetical protein MLD52_00205 [Puniceicoccaceae bacterium K14]|nr:hypothetical protein [Puniceicoccaceae bacterium K14]